LPQSLPQVAWFGRFGRFFFKRFHGVKLSPTTTKHVQVGTEIIELF